MIIGTNSVIENIVAINIFRKYGVNLKGDSILRAKSLLNNPWNPKIKIVFSDINFIGFSSPIIFSNNKLIAVIIRQPIAPPIKDLK